MHERSAAPSGSRRPRDIRIPSQGYLKNGTIMALRSTEFRRDTSMEYKSWMCLICGWIYDEEAGLPDEGIPPGTRWEDVPINWTCPECGARKEDFEMVQI